MNENKDQQQVIEDETTMLKTPSVNEQKTPATRPSKRGWKEMVIGGVPGILIGAGAVLTTQAFSIDHPEEDPAAVEDAKEQAVDNQEASQEESAGEPLAEMAVATTVNDEMSFLAAFVAARDEIGPGGAFSWHGNVYSTYRSDDPEWIELGPEGQQAHCEEIISQIHPSPYTEETSTVEEVDVESVSILEAIVDDSEEVTEEVREESEAEPSEEFVAEVDAEVKEAEVTEGSEEELEEKSAEEPEEALSEEPAKEPEEELIAEVEKVPEEPAEESAEEPEVEVESVIVEEVPEETVVEVPEGKPTIEQIIKLYEASEPLVEPETLVEQETQPAPENVEEKPTIEQIIKLYEASEPVVETPSGTTAEVAENTGGGVSLDIFSEVRGLEEEAGTGDEINLTDL